MLGFTRRAGGAFRGSSVARREILQVANKRGNITTLSEMNEKQKSLYNWIVKQRKVWKNVVLVNYKRMITF